MYKRHQNKDIYLPYYYMFASYKNNKYRRQMLSAMGYIPTR